MAETWTLRLAGPPLLRVGGRDHVLDGQAAVVAARLALDGPQPRSVLAGLLWPGADPARARANLRQSLLRLKQQAGQPWITGDATLALASEVVVEPPDEPDAAPLLQGVVSKDQDELACWLDQARQRQRRNQLATLQAAAQAAEAGQRWPEAIDAVQRQLAIDPLSEAGHRSLIRLHYLAQDLPRASAAFGVLKALLEAEFGAAPSAETLALMRLVLTAAAEPPRTVSVSPGPGPALMRPPRLVGRQRELAAVQEAVARRRPLLLLGEAGMGKSRLLAEALQHAVDAVIVKAQVGDGGVPYATLARLLRRVFDRHPALPRPAVLARLLPETAAGHDATQAVTEAVTEAVTVAVTVAVTEAAPAATGRRLLQEAVQQVLAGARVQLVAWDDLHFTDSATLELLPLLMGEDSRAVAWLFARRPGEGPATVDAWVATVEEGCGLGAHAMSPLDEDQMVALLQDLQLPWLDAAEAAPRLHRHTGGNPLFVLETLKSMQPSLQPARPMAPDGSPALPQPTSVAALIDRRLRRLSAPALALARVAAIAGADFGPALAESVTGRAAIELADAWAELETAQVLRDNAFAHDLVREAALRGVPKAIAARLHAAVAQHLAGLPPGPGRAARLATHWQAAGDGAAAWPWLLQAADEARDALRRREEAEFIEQAARLAPALQPKPAPSALSLWLRAYLARECVGGLPAALPALDQALQAAADDRERLQVQVMRTAALIDGCDFEQGLAVGQPALQLALRLGDDSRAATVLTKLGSALAMTGRSEEAAALLAQHWPVVERLPVPVPANFTERALLLDNLGRPQEARPFHRRCIDLAFDQGLHSEQVIGRLNLAVSLLDTGEPEAARVELQVAERLRLAHDDLNGVGVIGWNLLALAERDLAHPTAALDWFERQLALDAEQLPARTPIDRLNRGWLWSHLGQAARALQDLSDDTAFADLPGWVTARAWHLRLRLAVQRGAVGEGLLQTARGHADTCELRPVREALRIEVALADAARPDRPAPDPAAALDAVRRSARDDGFHGQFWAATWAGARCALLQGDADRARRLAAEATACPVGHVPADLWPGAWWHGLWQVWRALGQPDAARAARAQGLAWIHRLLQDDLAPEFHRALRDAVPAHRELLTAT
ncbi:MAG: AAA family ATPase [Burkholderiaceae bacterium]|nr:AAA family ATPase [Burkholderiaceae bacterium]